MAIPAPEQIAIHLCQVHDKLARMIRLHTIVFCFSAMIASSHAMNWEGHDDWMTELPAAKKLEATGEKPLRSLQLPAKPQKCLGANEIGQVPANPYENILPLCNELHRPEKPVK